MTPPRARQTARKSTTVAVLRSRSSPRNSRVPTIDIRSGTQFLIDPATRSRFTFSRPSLPSNERSRIEDYPYESRSTPRVSASVAPYRSHCDCRSQGCGARRSTEPNGLGNGHNFDNNANQDGNGDTKGGDIEPKAGTSKREI